jgi:tetratricopeptide (TPR) repeat protein
MDPNSDSGISPNEVPQARIPGPGRRVLAIVGIALIAAVAAGAWVAFDSSSGSASGAETDSKPLDGKPPLVLDLPGTPTDGSTDAQLKAAEQRLPAGDVRIAVARAIVGYTPGDRQATIDALRELPQDDAVVAFHLGVAELWAGDPKDAQADLRHAKQLDPYGFYGERADNALHYNMPRGYPWYFPPTTPAERPSLAKLRAAVKANPRNSAAWLQLAVALEQQHRMQAIEAARKAVEASPTAVSPRVALAVLSFDKDRPAASMGQLGPMLQQDEGNTEIRFHIGLLSLWVGLTTQALGEFRQVLREDPHGSYAKLSQSFIDKLDTSSSSG